MPSSTISRVEGLLPAFAIVFGYAAGPVIVKRSAWSFILLHSSLSVSTFHRRTNFRADCDRCFRRHKHFLLISVFRSSTSVFNLWTISPRVPLARQTPSKCLGPLCLRSSLVRRSCRLLRKGPHCFCLNAGQALVWPRRPGKGRDRTLGTRYFREYPRTGHIIHHQTYRPLLCPLLCTALALCS